MDVLVVGSGGREHTLCWSLARSPRLGELFCAPGNAGTAGLATNLSIAADDLDGLVTAATEHGVYLVVVGPEVPLAGGLADRLQERGVPVFGPSAASARIESSKAWTKELLGRIGVPTPSADIVRVEGEAGPILDRSTYPLVLKADGLAAGKGVSIVGDRAEAGAVLDDLLVRRSLGAAAERVLIEEYVEGRELSVLAFCDGERLAVMPAARDYKRAFDGNLGPNTGGMGAYSRPSPATPALLDKVESEILKPVVRALADAGTPFRGVLYAGLMVTERGPVVLEFNCRFGDPETQVILPLLESDPLDVMTAVAEGRLSPEAVRWHEGVACGVVLASNGYPGSYATGRPIEGLSAAAEDALVFHSGTTRAPDGTVLTDGGRVLTVVGRGPDVEEARRRAYGGLSALRFEGCRYRTDVGLDDGVGVGHDRSPIGSASVKGRDN